MSRTAPSLQSLSPGDLVCGEYVIEALERQTRLGLLYTARSRSPSDAAGRYEVRVPFTSSAGSAAMFVEHMQGLARVTHRAVAPVVRCGVEAVGPVLVSRALAPGSNLRALLSEGGSIPPGDVGGLIGEVAAALDAFHSLPRPVVHRALSPSEITVGAATGAVQVGACGLVHALAASRWLDDHSEDFTDPWYLSPDALLDQIHPRMDTFVLASIAYECLTGSPAFPDAGDHAAILKGSHPRASAARPALGPAVDAALARAWAPAPGAPFDTATAFAAALAAALHAPPARPVLRLATAPDRSGVHAAPVPPPAPAAAPAVVVAPSRPRTVVPLAGASLRELDLDDLWGPRDEATAPRAAAWGVTPIEAPKPLSPKAITARPPEPSTISPPAAYPAWAGRVSRPDAALVAPPDGFAPPRAPRVVSEPADASTPTAPPVTLPRRSVRAPRRPRASLAASHAASLALAKIASRAAAYLSVAIVAAAIIVTVGRVYQARHTPPAAASAPPRAPLRPAPAPSMALAPMAVLPAPAVAAPAPAVEAPAPATEAAAEVPATLAAQRERVIAAASACVDAGQREHHVRLRVNYDPAGRPTGAAVRGAFAVAPYAECIERAAVTVPLPARARGTASIDFLFLAPVSR
ncbi:MAG: hypothetical protein Q7V43_30195 [Myxococcales bacterium]|nr:hypothetical protein [Myxococcales bacterium]